LEHERSKFCQGLTWQWLHFILSHS
jgi:hypothetical protein